MSRSEEENFHAIFKSEHSYYNEIWNEAIEAAAKECEAWDKGVSPKVDIAPEIRKLKK